MTTSFVFLEKIVHVIKIYFVKMCYFASPQKIVKLSKAKVVDHCEKKIDRKNVENVQP